MTEDENVVEEVEVEAGGGPPDNVCLSCEG